MPASRPDPLRAAPRLSGAYWVVDTLPPDRVNVAPDSWIDQAQLARVIAARTLRPYAPLATEEK